MGLDARHEQQIDRLDDAIRVGYANRSSAGRMCQTFRVLNRQHSAIGQVEIEWHERPFATKVRKLLGGHT